MIGVSIVIQPARQVLLSEKSVPNEFFTLKLFLDSGTWCHYNIVTVVTRWSRADTLPESRVPAGRLALPAAIRPHFDIGRSGRAWQSD
jgi:hypothetical protein